VLQELVISSNNFQCTTYIINNLQVPPTPDSMASITNKPTIVIVPGGWHPPLLYSALSEAIQSAAYPVLTIHHPSFNPSLPLTDGAGTCAADALAARDTILPLIEEGREIIIYAHSWGGIPAGGCARGLSKSSRDREGKKGGVLGLVYNSALLVQEGMSVLEFFGGNHAPFVVEGHVSPYYSSSAFLRGGGKG
jgi:pimeloyl-ACP methyl ester carboxylesterase